MQNPGGMSAVGGTAVSDIETWHECDPTICNLLQSLAAAQTGRNMPSFVLFRAPRPVQDVQLLSSIQDVQLLSSIQFASESNFQNLLYRNLLHSSLPLHQRKDILQSSFSACPSGRFMISCPWNGQRVIRRQLHAAALLLLLRHAPRLVDVLRRHGRQLGHPPSDVPPISVVVLALRSAENEATSHPTNKMHGKDM